MKRTILAMAMGVMVLVGCVPEKRVSWSPDGRWATVRAGDGLYLCDPNGTLSERIAEHVASVAWFSDSRRVLLSRSVTVKDWAELTAGLPADEIGRLTELGAQLEGEVLRYEGDWDDFKPRMLEEQTGEIVAAALLYVRDRATPELRAKVGEKWADLEKIDGTVTTLQVAQVAGATLRLGDVWCRFVGPLNELRLSPDDTHVVMASTMPGEGSPKRLLVAALEPNTTPRDVAECTSVFADWSPDGRSLYFAAGSAGAVKGGDALRLGVIARRAVRDEKGTLLISFPEPEHLAGILFEEQSTVRCLRDGRVLFMTLEVQLPSATKDMAQQPTLFALDPQRQATIVRLTPRQTQTDLAEILPIFEPSPDQTRICVSGPDGHVLVVSIATGDVWKIATDDDVDELRSLPTWRTDEELCLNFGPVKDAQGARGELVLARLNWQEQKSERRVLSADWPPAVVEDFLVKRPEQSPATQPTP
jgi:Tol biopolymer transport system component